MTRLLLLALGAALAPAPGAARADDAAKVFEERIAPIFKSADPSSCARCHLASVDIKNYILPSARDTFLALREQGLIDLEKPEGSKILQLINRGADDPKGAGLISAKRQRAEYEAFAAWVKAPPTRRSRTRRNRRRRPLSRPSRSRWSGTRARTGCWSRSSRTSGRCGSGA
jgi:hypothetical protein